MTGSRGWTWSVRTWSPAGRAELFLVAHRSLRPDDPGYPARLRDLPDPPDPIHLAGPWDHDGPVVAIVGSRGSLADALELTMDLAGDLASQGVAVVSGMALGIDGAAHHGALRTGGRSGAVLGTELGVSYPRAHAALQQSLAASLGLMSEIPAGTHATRGTFASRNRLIAALSHAVILVQGDSQSGALLTVRAAESLGRPVGAIPWDLSEPLAAAPHALIRERRAVLIRDAADALALLGEAPSATLVRALAARRDAKRVGGASRAEGGGALESRVLAGLRRRAEPLDVVATRASLPAAETSAALLALELAGLARREPGGRFRRTRSG